MDAWIESNGIRSPDDLLTLLSQPNHKYVPFPSPSLSDLRRFHFCGSDFSYFGRLINVVESKQRESRHQHCMRVVGVIGSGKSHLLAAYVLYMRYLRNKVPETPRVVYIPRCSIVFKSVIDVDVVRLFAKEVSAAFSDHEGWNTLVNTENPLEWSHIKNFSLNLDSNSVIFVFDDWNYMLDTQKSHVEQWQCACTAISENQFRVEVVSANSATMKDSSASISREDWYWYDGSLMDDEWAAWCEAKPLLQILEQTELDQLRYMTGGQPLLVNELAKVDLSKMKDDLADSESYLNMSVDNYYREGDVMSYTWMRTELGRTLHSIKNNTASHEFEDHIAMMTRSLAHLPTDNIMHLYDHRFFYYDKTTGLLKCCCGFTEDVLRHLLYKTEEQLYKDKLEALWAKKSKLYEMNPSVRGFAFEELVLAMLPIKYHLLLPNVLKKGKIDVVVFDGVFPDSLNSRGGTLYRPSKWNLRYVDAVIRANFPEKKGVVYVLIYRFH